jgi:hypothetical protein
MTVSFLKPFGPEIAVWELNHPDLKATHTFGDDRKVRPVQMVQQGCVVPPVQRDRKALRGQRGHPVRLERPVQMALPVPMVIKERLVQLVQLDQPVEQEAPVQVE